MSQEAEIQKLKAQNAIMAEALKLIAEQGGDIVERWSAQKAMYALINAEEAAS